MRSGAANLWAAHEIEYELQRLLLALPRNRAKVTGEDLDKIRLRVDILWSRIPPILEGRTGSVLREVADITAIVASLKPTLQVLSDELDTNPGNASAFSDTVSSLENFERPLRDFVLAALHHSSERHVELQQRLGEIHVSSLVVSGVFGVSTAALITLLLVQLNKSRRLCKKREEANTLINHLAHHDTLTGLPNRRLFNENLVLALDEARARSGRVSLHFIDIDNFKAINDAHGHTFGDEFLIAASKRMAETIRTGDTLARIAGDEFAAIQADAGSPIDVTAFDHLLLQAFARPFHIDGHSLRASISIGSTLFPNDGDSAERLLSNADVALHCAKSNGRRQSVLFDEAIFEKEQRRRLLVTRMERALDLDELSVHYQPKFSARLGSLTGVEALIRWDRGALVEVSPSEFVPMAEDSGAIVAIGDWVLSTACRDIATWTRAHGVDISLSVNLSPIQLREEDCFVRLRSILEASHFDPHRLEFEITETSLINDDPVVLSNIRGLRSIGARICLDDFGTGYSSLSHLQSFPLNAMKLDRGFVSRLDDLRTKCICEGITQLGHRLGLEIVGEGAETEWQYHELVRMGCDQLQGFYLGRPMPIGELDGLLFKPPDIQPERKAAAG